VRDAVMNDEELAILSILNLLYDSLDNCVTAAEIMNEEKPPEEEKEGFGVEDEKVESGAKEEGRSEKLERVTWAAAGLKGTFFYMGKIKGFQKKNNYTPLIFCIMNYNIP